MTNVGWGAIGGLVLGGLLTLFVVIPRTLGPVESTLPAPLWIVGAIYVLGGLFAGLIAGALSSRIQTWYQAGFVGVLAIMPSVIAIGISDSGWNGTDDIEGIAVISVVLGFPVGVIMRKIIIEVDPFGDI